ncbi:hypothetical protein M378DRAFT_644717 [Amanita muscaria Koide BX008]|uniref:Uncharacterized protein n=1 Tax=Amanita muscaria (strain Koide BX008) TaxID=946122 RepID=A0A0C2WGM1_AMAMK|nr:hypothetical protein M378DRAFT_644717 [Amanita muscaria Koide BX008]
MSAASDSSRWTSSPLQPIVKHRILTVGLSTEDLEERSHLLPVKEGGPDPPGIIVSVDCRTSVMRDSRDTLGSAIADQFLLLNAMTTRGAILALAFYLRFPHSLSTTHLRLCAVHALH